MNDYPRMMYRDGEKYDVNGVQVDTWVVSDAEEQADAMAQGWRTSLLPVTHHPLDHDGDGRLGGSVPKRRGRPSKDVATVQ